MAKKRKKTKKELEQELERAELFNKVYKNGLMVAAGIVFGLYLLENIAPSLKHHNKINTLKKQLKQANNRESRILKSKIVHLKRKIRKLTIKIK